MPKPAMMIAIGIGKKKPPEDDGLRSPDPVDGMPPKPKAPADAEQATHEEGEAKMDFGMIGQKFGLSEDESKAFAYDVLEACMKATGGAAHEVAEGEETGETGEETDEYGQRA
jgi:hypothetical protein